MAIKSLAPSPKGAADLLDGLTGDVGNIAVSLRDSTIDVHGCSRMKSVLVPDDHQCRQLGGAACAAAALTYLQYGLAPLILCDPDHIGIRRINPTHARACTNPGKQVVLPTWKQFQNTLPSEEEVHRWWDILYPIGNVGVVCGQVSGAVRMDCDGEAGTRLLQAWSQGDLPDTWMFASPASGPQRLYAWPREMPCRSVTQAEKGVHNELRLMGNGAQTVMPPSRHPLGGQYTWVPGYSPEERPLAMAPAWLIARMRGNSRDEDTALADQPPADLAVVTAALAAIPNDDADYDTWLLLGMALHSTGEDWAEELWDAWSQQSGKYRATKQHKSWESFHHNGPVTLGTLFYLAQQAGWRFPQQTAPRRPLRDRAVVRRPTLHLQAVSVAEVHPWH